MSKQELNTLLRDMVEQKSNTAFESMKGFSRCEELYNMMAKESAQLAEAFKSIVFYTMILHPDYTEQQVLVTFYNKMYNK